MKRIVWNLIALLAVNAAALFAQDVTGTWQGTIHIGNNDLRTVIKISKDDNDLKALFYSIDQGGTSIPSSSVTLQGTNVKLVFPGIGGSYDGAISPDGKSIAGTFTQGRPLPLNLQRATGQTAWDIPAAPPKQQTMPPGADPSFAVSTIKLSKPDQQGKAINVLPGGRFRTLNYTLLDLVTFAYQVQARQLSGLPAWADTEKYDIVGEPDTPGIPNDRQVRGMVAKLLAERFKLTFHRDRKELSVYAITSLKTANKLTPSTGDPNGLPGLGFRGLGSMMARNANLNDVAQLLQNFVLDRPVVDQSGVKGRYDLTLDWHPDEFQFQNFGNGPRPPAPTDDSRPDLFTAFQQQLGLKLESTKATVEILVIDHADHPSEN